MTARLALVGCLVGFSSFANAHRLDEYLQVTTVSFEGSSVSLQMQMTPGVRVADRVIQLIDANKDGVISETEKAQYGQTVVKDLRLKVDGLRERLTVSSIVIPPISDLKKGVGEISISLKAPLSETDGARILVFENHHLDQISAYQVNCLQPATASLHVTNQSRDYLQTRYELSFSQGAAKKLSRAKSLPWMGAGIAGFMLPFAFMAWRARRK